MKAHSVECSECTQTLWCACTNAKQAHLCLVCWAQKVERGELPVEQASGVTGKEIVNATSR